MMAEDENTLPPGRQQEVEEDYHPTTSSSQEQKEEDRIPFVPFSFIFRVMDLRRNIFLRGQL